jgi:hypothetical protein
LKTAILRSIRQAEDHVGDVPTVQEFEQLSSISQNVVYRFFDTWDEALDAAGARGVSWTPTIDVEETDLGNPDFVDGLLKEIDKHIEGS